jgi:hypothetical protein
VRVSLEKVRTIISILATVFQPFSSGKLNGPFLLII